MGKRSRRRGQPQPPATHATLAAARPQQLAPGRSLLNAIANGDLDDHLTALADATDARLHLLHTIEAATALAALSVGDEVCINDTVKPKYLRGVHGRIIDLDEDTATVCLHRPIGRFTSGHVRCPPLALDRLDPQTQALAS